MKDGRTIKKILETDKGRTDRSHQCFPSVVGIHTVIEKEIPFLKRLLMWFKRERVYFYKVIVFKVAPTDRTVVIQLCPNFSFSRFINQKIKIYCSCEDFLYRSAYFNAESDSLFVNASNRDKLQYAIDNHPEIDVTTSCKHVLACVRYIYTNYEKMKLSKL